MAQVEIRDLEKSYGTVKSVDGVSLDVADGELVTLRIKWVRQDHDPPHRGRVDQRGPRDGSDWRAVDARRPPWRRNVGIVFQHYALFPHMTVQDNIAYGLRLRKWKGPRIRG